MKISQTLFLILPLTFSFNLHAAISNMKPGLWEHHFIIKSESGKVEKAMADLKTKMANMTPDQRKMMESAMAAQGVGLNPKDNSVKVCITKEQAQKLEIPQGQNQNCTQEVVNRTNNSIKMKFNCKGITDTNGEGEFTLTSPTAYTGKSVINTTKDGKADRMDLNQTGKWLSSNCGEIKPFTTKK